jgi:hypothetical protein
MFVRSAPAGAQENIIFGWNIIIPATASMIRLSRSLISNSVCRVR